MTSSILYLLAFVFHCRSREASRRARYAATLRNGARHCKTSLPEQHGLLLLSVRTVPRSAVEHVLTLSILSFVAAQQRKTSRGAEKFHCCERCASCDCTERRRVARQPGRGALRGGPVRTRLCNCNI
jgi:hypothetical protein